MLILIERRSILISCPEINKGLYSLQNKNIQKLISKRRYCNLYFNVFKFNVLYTIYNLNLYFFKITNQHPDMQISQYYEC